MLSFAEGLLLKAPGIDLNKVDKKRKTALNLAAKSSHTAIVEMLRPLQPNRNCTIL
ncbi:hypothetical protein [Cardinium endosymbiont of Tipula unca]|uniref:hypothetical protein n=1 Tax=Cardinium endosymbiont of Tipula unca TaxID=3066216 RepID=UPI0030CC7178